MRWLLPGGAVLGGRSHWEGERLVACRPLAAVVERRKRREATVPEPPRVNSNDPEGRVLFLLCPNCGKHIATTEDTCPHCGHPVDSIEVPVGTPRDAKPGDSAE